MTSCIFTLVSSIKQRKELVSGAAFGKAFVIPLGWTARGASSMCILALVILCALPVPVGAWLTPGAQRSAVRRTLRRRICMFTAQRIKGPCSYHCRTEYYKSSLRIPNPLAARPLFGNIKKPWDRNNQFPNDTLSNKTFLILSLPSPFSLPLPQLDNLTWKID